MSIGERTSEPNSVSRSRFEGKAITIFGINYWPELTGNAPYTAGLAEHLVRRGARVSVVAGYPYYPQWSVLPEYGRELRRTEVHNGVTIHRYRQYIPGKQTAARRAGFEASFLLNSWLSNRAEKPDLVLGILPALSDGVLAMRAAERHNVPFGLLVQDLVGQSAAQTGTSGAGRVAGVTTAIESHVARKAKKIGIIAEGFRHHLIEMGVEAHRIQRLRNWTHIGQPTLSPAATRASLGLPEDAWIALHAGNMGAKQGLENLIDAARVSADAGSESPLFVLMGGGNQEAMLKERASDLPNVRFLPPQPEDSFADALAAADVLLVNQRPSVVDSCLPGKLTSYLAVGKPVVAAVSDKSETARELRSVDAGLVVPAGAPEQLLGAILELKRQPERGVEIAENGRAFAFTELTAEAALANLEAFIGSMMSGSSERTGEYATAMHTLNGISNQPSNGGSND